MQFQVGGIRGQAVVVGLVHQQGVCRLVIELGVPALLADVVVGISGLQAQGLFLFPFVHPVSVQRMRVVE